MSPLSVGRVRSQEMVMRSCSGNVFLLGILLFVLSGTAVAGDKSEKQIDVGLFPYYRSSVVTGFTQPIRTMAITSEVGARCLHVLADRGDFVPESGLLVELDPTFVDLDLKRNRLAQDQTKRRLELEKKNLERFTTLYRKDSAPAATYEEAALQRDIQALGLESLINEEQRLLELKKRHHVTGPPGWQVTERTVEPGEVVRQGQQLMRLASFQKIMVPFFLTFTELQEVKARKKISLYLPELDREVVASLSRISPDYDTRSRKIRVEFHFGNAEQSRDSGVRSGIRAELELSKPEAGLYTLSRAALISRYEAHWLRSARTGELVKVIYLGESQESDKVIVSGALLQADDRFLIPQPKD